MKERKEFRKEREKHFENADHSFTAAVYGQPVHFMENGEWTEIDNTVVSGTDGRYENKKNDLKVSFAGEASDERLIEVRKDGHRLSWKMKGALRASVCPGKKPDPRKKKADMEVMGLHAGMSYKNVQDGMDLEYELRSKTLKENIILNRLSAGGKVVFEIDTDLVPETEGGRILFKTNDDEKIFVMAAPFMFDAAGKESHAIEVMCEGKREPGKFVYTLIPDEAWLKAPERKWPVVIDPVISSSVDYSAIADARITSGYPGSSFGEGMYLVTGQSSSMGTCRSLVNFDLPELDPADMVVGATFNVTCFNSYSGSRRVELHRILEPWDCYTVTWNNCPRYDSKIVDLNTFTPQSGSGVSFDITDLVKDWYANGNRYGILLKDSEEVGNYTDFVAADTSDAIMEARPRVYIRYVNHTGIQDFWTYHSQDIRRAGQVHVNDHNGNLIYQHVIDAISGNRMPYALTLVYNTDDKDTDIGYGRGFRLNCHQQVMPGTIDGVQYHEWIDGTGTHHYFKLDNEKNKWLDELDPDLELTIGTSGTAKYTIQSKHEDKLIFNSSGFLVKVQDVNGNILSIAYDGSSRISSVTDGAGRVLSAAYTGASGITFTDPAARTKTLTLSGGYLTSVTDFDDAQICLAYTDGLLTSITNFDGHKMVYAYTGTPARVRSVREYTGEELCRTLDITYGFNTSIFTDERGRSEYYMFNSAGHTVSVKNDEGYAQVTERMTEGAAVNRLSSVSELQRTVPQYVKNPQLTAFDFTGWTGEPGSGVTTYYNMDAAYSRTGDCSLVIRAEDASSSGAFSQKVMLEKGKTYTFSGYVMIRDGVPGESGGAGLKVSWKDADGVEKHAVSGKVTDTGDEWVCLEVPFTLGEEDGADGVTVRLVSEGLGGSACFDDLQMEDGSLGNRRNLVENNVFTHGLHKFTGSGLSEGRDGLIDLWTSVRETVPAGRGAEICVEAAHVRTGAGDSHGILCTLGRRHIVTILGTETAAGGTWYHVGFGLEGAGYDGYVSAGSVQVFEEGVRTGRVTADILNLRTGPGTSYSTLLQLPFGTVLILGAEQNVSGSVWQAATAHHGGEAYTGYVSADYIREITASETGCPSVRVQNVPLPPEMLGETVLCITGDPAAEKRMTQTVHLDGKAGDAYVISGWGCGDALPVNAAEDGEDQRRFGVELEFTYRDASTERFYAAFGAEPGEWQYACRAAVAKQEYAFMKVSYVYDHNANRAYFSGLSLFKDEHWPSFTYDDDGHVISCTDAGKQKTTFAYDMNSNITKVTTPTGAEFDYTYDSKHRITDAVTATGKRYAFEYDSFGNLVSHKVVDPENAANFIRSRYAYTSDGNYPLKNTDCFGKEVVYEYEPSTGDLKSVTDVNGKKTSYTYDEMGRLLSISKPNTVNGTEVAVTQTYTYEDDRMKTIRHNGMDYVFTYDNFGNVTQVSVGGRVLVTHTYAMNGTQLQKSIYGNGQSIHYAYDNFDRVIRKTEKDAAGNTVQDLKYLYDHEGHLASVGDYSGFGNVNRYHYSLSGTLAREEDGEDSFTKFIYDDEERLTSLYRKASGGAYTSGYSYDADGREVQTTTFGGRHLSTVYDALGRIASQTLDTDTAFVTGFSYRAAEDGTATPVVSSMNNGGKNTAIQYHDDGNIKQVTTSAGTVAYEYDNLGQLIRVDDAVNNKTYIYTYDAGFNMTSEKVYACTTESTPTAEPVSQRAFVYDSAWKDQMVSCGGKTMTYDGVGNLTSFDGVTYTWTRGRKLSQVTKADGTVITYEYDHQGRRVKKTVNGEEAVYAYVGDLMFSATSSGREQRFSYDSVGNPVAVMYNGVEYYYVKNIQGDIIGLVDGSGTWVVEYRYDAWGNVLSVTGTLAATLGQDNPLRYRGYFYDAETGLYYLGSRYYSPELCRFIGPDSGVSGAGGDMRGNNMYTYCFNNPVNMDDPDGNWPKWVQKLGNTVKSIVSNVKKKVESVVAKLAIDAVNYNLNNKLNNTSERSVLSANYFSAYKGNIVIKTNFERSGSYGALFISRKASERSAPEDEVRHEYGHTKQLDQLGLAKYTMCIGVPSMFEWGSDSVYYRRPWEITADIYGGVQSRSYPGYETAGFEYLENSKRWGPLVWLTIE